MASPAARHPIDPRALFVLVLCVVSGLPLLAGVTEPGSIEETLPAWAILLWALGLTGGAVMTLFGMSKQTADGVIAEQIGSVTVGVSTLFYGSVILLTAGWSAALPAGIIFCWGAANLWRWVQLQAYLQDVAARVEEIHEGET